MHYNVDTNTSYYTLNIYIMYYISTTKYLKDEVKISVLFGNMEKACVTLT